MTIHKIRHMCRNTHCRLKLPTPVENEHHAFCTKGCHAVFYRTRCQVCEEPIRRKTERQLTCFSRKCKSERRRFPAAYSWPEYKTNETGGFGAPNDENHPTIARASLPPSEVPILRGLKHASEPDRPRHHCLRMWSWGGDGVADHSLYDGDGLTVARIMLDGDRYLLRCPNVWPRQSWADLERAKHGAESFALTAARVARDNIKPHPMAGPSFGTRELQMPQPELQLEAPLPPDADPWAIPDFLVRGRA